MNTITTIIAFPFKLAGKLILLVLVLSLVATVVGVAGFLFTPTDTPIGHNTTRWELIQAEKEQLSKMPEMCSEAATFGAFLALSRNSFTVIGMSLIWSIMDFTPVKNIMLPNGGEYQTKSLSLMDHVTLSWKIVTETVDLMLWNNANSGYYPKNFKTPNECVFPLSFVKLQTSQPDFKDVVSYFAKTSETSQ